MTEVSWENAIRYGNSEIHYAVFIIPRQELAIIVRDDTEKVNCTMAGVPFVANKFARDLRVRLFSEYPTKKKEGKSYFNFTKISWHW